MPENRFLAALSREDRARLDPFLQCVILKHGDRVAEPGKPITDIYFPQGALSSIIVLDNGGMSVEASLVGCEAPTALPEILGEGIGMDLCEIQVPGDALKMETGAFRQAFNAGGAFRDLCIRYIQYLAIQTRRTCLCNRVHEIDRRLAKWLLMAADGVQAEVIDITHEYLAIMLGVHRPGVTNSAAALREAGAIEYTRGRITIVDRKKLESFSCDCYRILREKRGKLLGM